MAKEFMAKKAYVDGEISRLDTKTDNIQSTLNVSIQALQDADVQFTKNLAEVSKTASLAKSQADTNAEEIKKKVNTSDLATVATTGDYDDLTNKPNIPEGVIVDSEFSNTSTNAIQNKVTKDKFDQVDSTLSSLTTDNNNQWDKIKTKVDNTKEGAWGLFNILDTDDIEPGDEENLIVQNLNVYTRRPLKKFLDWILSHLAKVGLTGSYNDLDDKPNLSTVATSGLYTDLKDKPTIPTIDADFSTTSTNGLSNKTITNKLNAMDDTIGSISTGLQSVSNSLSNKADKSALPTNFVKSGSGAKAGLVPAPSTTAGTTKYLREDGTWTVPPNSNTTYTAGTGISLSGTTFSNSGVRSISSGTTNGTISVNTNGTSTEVAVKGLGSAAYTASTAYATSSHTHNYAGSSSAGGSATSAVALTSKSIGSTVIPTYFDANGKPAVCKYTLDDASTKIVRTLKAIGHTGWANQATDQKYVPDMAFMAWWNGAYNSSGGSSLAYCNKGEFGTAATKGVDTAVTDDSANLITSGGVSTALASYRPNIIKNTQGTPGKTGYICFAQLTVTETYANNPLEFVLLRRGASTPCKVSIKFVNSNSVDPNISTLVVMGESYNVYAYKSATSTWELYAMKSEAYDILTILTANYPHRGISVTYPGTQVNTKHTTSTNNPVVNATWGYRVEAANTATAWNGWINDINTKNDNNEDTWLLIASNNKVQHRLSTSFAAASHSHSAATTSAAGYMSAADKTKLDGIATGANKYSLPTASSTTLGGVKTTSTVTSTSGLTACPIISGVPYYKDTNNTYSSLKNPYAITIQGNGATLTNGTYDGSAAKTVNITPANIGACKATDGIVNNSFKVTKSSGATLTTTAAADKITMSTDKKLYIGDDSGFASSTKIYGTFDHAQTVLYSATSSTSLASVSIANLFTEYSLIWLSIQGSKTYHSHVIPLKYLKSKGQIVFKDAGSSAIVPLNLLYVSDTEMRWFEYQAQGAETYTAVQVVKIY